MPENNEAQYELDNDYAPLGIVDADDGSGTTWPEFVEQVNKMDNQVAALTEARDSQNQISYEETLTGKTWVDGRPIYRKAIKLNNLSAGITNTVGTLSDIDALLMVYGFLNDKYNHLSVPYLSGLSTYGISVFVSKSTGEVKIDVSQGVTFDGCVVVLEYVKTLA